MPMSERERKFALAVIVIVSTWFAGGACVLAIDFFLRWWQQ
jgi:hypothetical protein